MQQESGHGHTERVLSFVEKSCSKDLGDGYTGRVLSSVEKLCIKNLAMAILRGFCPLSRGCSKNRSWLYREGFVFCLENVQKELAHDHTKRVLSSIKKLLSKN